MNVKNTFSWVLKLCAAVILLQTLYFKFTAHPDSVLIFSALGVEPWGRVGLGIIELIVAVAILIPKTQLIGMISCLSIMVGAILSHLLVLGIQVASDGGGLFTLALAVFLASSIFLWMHKKDVLSLVKKIIS
ncbi:MAG: DoxX family protein [Cytophagaceae bacterium]|jgi:hypothetical protein|nr:DoxX family protein [Cytophagaceae bacterium]